MNARLERKLRLRARIVAGSVIAAIGFVLARGYTSPSALVVGISYALFLSVALAAISLFVLQGPMRMWLSGLSFTAHLAVRSAIYAAIIIPTLYFQLGEVIARVPLDPTRRGFWIAMVYCVVFLFLVNLVIGITNIIGGRAFL